MEECYFYQRCRLKPTTLLQIAALLHRCFSRFFNCTNGTKSRKTPHITFFLFSCLNQPTAFTLSQITSWSNAPAVQDYSRPRNLLQLWKLLVGVSSASTIKDTSDRRLSTKIVFPWTAITTISSITINRTA